MNTNYILQYCTLWQYCQETWSFLGNLEFSRKLGVFSETWSFLRNVRFSRKLGVFSDTWSKLQVYTFLRSQSLPGKWVTTTKLGVVSFWLITRLKVLTKLQVLKKSEDFSSERHETPGLTVPGSYHQTPELDMQQFFSFATTTTRQRNIASGTRKKSKNS